MSTNKTATVTAANKTKTVKTSNSASGKATNDGLASGAMPSPSHDVTSTTSSPEKTTKIKPSTNNANFPVKKGAEKKVTVKQEIPEADEMLHTNNCEDEDTKKTVKKEIKVEIPHCSPVKASPLKCKKEPVTPIKNTSVPNVKSSPKLSKGTSATTQSKTEAEKDVKPKMEDEDSLETTYQIYAQILLSQALEPAFLSALQLPSGESLTEAFF